MSQQLFAFELLYLSLYACIGVALISYTLYNSLKVLKYHLTRDREGFREPLLDLPDIEEAETNSPRAQETVQRKSRTIRAVDVIQKVLCSICAAFHVVIAGLSLQTWHRHTGLGISVGIILVHGALSLQWILCMYSIHTRSKIYLELSSQGEPRVVHSGGVLIWGGISCFVYLSQIILIRIWGYQVCLGPTFDPIENPFTYKMILLASYGLLECSSICLVASESFLYVELNRLLFKCILDYLSTSH